MNSKYNQRIQDRSFLHYFIGLIIRWKANIEYARRRNMARRKGAAIGEYSIIPMTLAKRANKNLRIGNHVSIQTDKIDLRNPISIGDYVIIGEGTEIITTSHDVDSKNWEIKNSSLTIEDYVWIPTKVLILPSCRNIGKGAVIGSGSVVSHNVDEMSIVSGNPATEIRKRKCVHSQLVVESLLGGDYHAYKEAYRNRHVQLK